MSRPDTLYIDPAGRFAVGYFSSGPLRHKMSDDWEGVDRSMIMRSVFSLDDFEEKIAQLEEDLNDVAVERMKFFLANVMHPRLKDRLSEVRFEGRVRVPRWVDNAEYGSLEFSLPWEAIGENMHIKMPMALYYEAVLACNIDPRMALPQGMVAPNVGSEWMATAMHTDPGVNMPYFRDKDVRGTTFSITSVTLRKTDEHPTLRLYGLYDYQKKITYSPPVFTEVTPLKNSHFMCVVNGSPVIMNPSGGAYDVFLRHMPPVPVIDRPDYLERVAQWAFDGVKFLYRDTTQRTRKNTFAKGLIVRSGFFVDTTPNLQAPAKGVKTRFLIMSAHAVPMADIKGVSEYNPETALWNLNLFHYNDYFMVMDVATVADITQVTLLHIPPSGRYCLNEEGDLEWLDAAAANYASFNGLTLVEAARKDFELKLAQERHPISLNKRWKERTHERPFIMSNGAYFDLDPVNPENQEIADFEDTIAASFDVPADVEPNYHLEARVVSDLPTPY